LNCRQILEHHLDRPQLATKIHQLAAEISTESSASRCKIDQISRPCGAMVRMMCMCTACMRWWYLQICGSRLH
jgi:hypothetical protein